MTPSLAARLHLDEELRPLDRGSRTFLHDVLAGLSMTQKTIPPKYFYDAAGSHLFTRICALPEYYPTRTEIAILRDAASAIADRAGADVALVEFGSGSSAKVRILLDALHAPFAYVPIDISGEYMRAAAAALGADFPALRIVPVEADFMAPVHLPPDITGKRLVGFFPGSTIGNLSTGQAEAFMRQAAKTLGEDAHFIVGVDLKKHGALLHAAYNDRTGVTAEFNLNLLRRINRELGGNFDVKGFRHRAFYNAPRGRVEMHLESLKPQRVQIAGDVFAFREGETIHTENSHKYSVAEFQLLCDRTGWRPVDCFVDDQSMFSVHYLKRR